MTAATVGHARQPIRAPRRASAAATCQSPKLIRRIPTSFTRQAQLRGAPRTRASPGRESAARPAATITRTFGSIRIIRKLFCWSAIRAHSSARTGAARGAPGTTSRPRRCITSSRTMAFRIAFAAASRIAARCAFPAVATTAKLLFRDWHPVGAIEYGYAVPDPMNPNIIYGSGRTDVTKYDWITGQTQKITPDRAGLSAIPLACARSR